MNGMTIGKYVPGNSVIHRIDPRLKLLGNIVFIILVFLSENFIMLGMLLVFPLLAYFFSPLRKKQLIKIMFPVLFIGIFLLLINSFLIQSEDAANTLWDSSHFTWWRFTLSDEAIMRTLLIMSRIYIMILITTLLTATTKPMALTRSIEDILYPFKLIKVPVHIIAMIISIALRFIPTLLDESQRIMKAQASRGVDFKNGNIKSKAKSLVTLIIPLFVSAFAKADDLGNAMETRGYDPYEKRTRYRNYPLKMLDAYIFILLVGMIIVVAFLNHGIISFPEWK